MKFNNSPTTSKRFSNVRPHVVFLSIMALWLVSASLNLATHRLNAQFSYSPQLRRYPYLTDMVGSYATINWATDRLESSGGVRYGKSGSESCTAHYVMGTKTAISVNSVLQYQWKAQLNLEPNTQYCYRVYLGTSPLNEIDLLGGDPSPFFWTQVPSGANESFSFVVFGDWGQVNSSGTNSYQASLMSLMASSGARFALTTGDNGYPSANQKNLGDLIQAGADISAVFGPSFWKVPGASLPVFPTLGNHGFYSADTYHPALITWPQDRAVSTSGGRYVKEVHCCLNGSSSRSYPSAWYAFDAGPARFYVLNAAWEETNIGTASEYEMDYDYHWAPGTPQYEWLAADLAAHPSVLKFAFFHYPLYSDNPFESTQTFLLGSSSLEGLLKQNGVDIAFTGHAHIYERNLASADGIINYITGGGGSTPGTLGTCTALDAYAIKFTTTGKACGSAPMPTSPDVIYHFLKVTVNGSDVTVNPINSLGQPFDVQNYSFTAGAETTAPSTPTNLAATVASGRQIDLSWSASSDDTGVRGYGIYRDGTLIDTVDTNTLTYSDIDRAPSVTYVYQVDAFDGSANHSSLSTSASATTPGTATYTFIAVADTYVAGDSATTNYGRVTTLKMDASPDHHSYLRFNVGDLGGTVTGATLRLYSNSSSSTGYQVRRVDSQSWEEGTATYANVPSVGTVLGVSGNISSGTWTSVDVTSLITGNGVYDLAITTTSTSSMLLASRDSSSNPPQLVIETSTNPPPTPTLTLPPTLTPTAEPGDTLTFAAMADARVSQSSPTTNYGTSTTIQADADGIASYVRFDANGISGWVQNAKLRVYCTTNGTNNGPAAYLADNNWIESGTGGITWNTQPALLSSAFDNKGAIATASWVEYDVTALVTGDGTYTFALVADGTDSVTFSSREGSFDPQLVVTLGIGTPTVTNTPTTTSTPTATPTAAVSTPESFLTFAAMADARVSQSSPTTNYGTSTTLQADAGTTQSYIRFDANGISGSIQNVKLRVYCTTNGTTNGPAAYLADNTWIESGAGGITWNTQPALLSGAFDNKGAIATASWVEYDVTALVTGDGTYTFALVADGSDGVTFSSREGSFDPQLVVTLASNTATSTSTYTSTPSDTPTVTPTFTSTEIATETFTPTDTPTNTATATPTDTPSPTATDSG